MTKTVEKLIADLNNGVISYDEFQHKQYLAQQQFFTPQLLEHMAKGEWEEFVHLALKVYEIMPIAFRYYDKVPDNLKYDFCIQAYLHHGDSIPAVRKAVREALKYGKPKLPKNMQNADFIEVYRAGEETIDKAPYRISWTTKKEVALFFLNEWRERHANHLYKAKIKPQDIIAYTNDREEFEIMQYRKVYDITEIQRIKGQ